MKKQIDNHTRIELLKTLKQRFEKNMSRHEGIQWISVENRLKANVEKLWTLNQMELSGGEPDVLDYNQQTSEYIFIDCSKESPIGRRSCCYDRKALLARKANKPNNNVLDLAKEIGITLLTEEQYKKYHALIGFDSCSSSWVLTPDEIRNLGGAIFCDFRYGKVFTYHNGAESYYGSRGFRGLLSV